MLDAFGPTGAGKNLHDIQLLTLLEFYFQLKIHANTILIHWKMVHSLAVSHPQWQP